MVKVLCVFLVAILAGCQANNIPPSMGWQTDYLLPGHEGVYLGMPSTDFVVNKVNAERQEQNYTFREVYVEDTPGKVFDKVVYYLDQDAPLLPLYEILYVFPAGIDVDAVADQRYGPRNHNSKDASAPPTEWLFDTPEGWKLNIWTYQNKIILAAQIPGTEWNE